MHPSHVLTIAIPPPHPSPPAQRRLFENQRDHVTATRHVLDCARACSNPEGPPRYVPPALCIGPITIFSTKAAAGAAGPPPRGRRRGQRVPPHHHHHHSSGGSAPTTTITTTAGAAGPPPRRRQKGWRQGQRGHHQYRGGGDGASGGSTKFGCRVCRNSLFIFNFDSTS